METKALAEMTLIREARRQGDFDEGSIRGSHLLAGKFHSKLADVIAHGATAMTAENTRQVHWMDTCGLADLLQG
jgi:hypothetical protein